MGFGMVIPTPPQRIISLVPSQTELLFDLGLANHIVGVTKFCIHPEEVKLKSKIGGTKKFDFNAIGKLQPDLIVGNKEENYEEGIAQLKKQYPVWMSDIISITDAYEMMLQLGEINAVADKSTLIVQQIQQKFSALKKFRPIRVLYLIWKNPWMVAGRKTFIDSLLVELGLVNAITDLRYPEITNEQITQLAPDIIFLSSEPFPFREKHIEELKQLAPAARIILVDGEMFSWYGSRLLKAPDYFESLRHQLN
jgi:ABC-type Fe3+-hydroxamate transport system substrate-binding protein